MQRSTKLTELSGVHCGSDIMRGLCIRSSTVTILRPLLDLTSFFSPLDAMFPVHWRHALGGFRPNTNTNEDLFEMATVSSKTESWAKALGGNHWQQVHVVIVGELLSLKQHAVKCNVGAAFQCHHRSASARFGQALVLLALFFRFVFIVFHYD